jgi:hypothetical protein
VVKLIGYDAGESHRVKDHDSKRFMVAYPLVEWGWRRRECVAVVNAAGFRPAKSACWFCPASKRGEVLSLAKTHPELFARAVAMESNATTATTAIGLGRNWRWSDLVKADEQQMKLFDELPDLARQLASLSESVHSGQSSHHGPPAGFDTHATASE